MINIAHPKVRLTQKFLVRIIFSPRVIRDNSGDGGSIDQMHILRVDENEFGAAMLDDV